MAKGARSNSADPIHQLLDALFRGIWRLISWPWRDRLAGQRLEQQRAELRRHWQAVQVKAERGEWRQAIMEADIILGQALELNGVAGANIGEKLKSLTGRWERQPLDIAWRAHKVRNKIAHELNCRLDKDEALAVLEDFRSTLRHVGI